MDASVPFRRPIGLRTASTMRASVTGDSIDRPGPRNALQLVLAAGLEGDPGAGDEVLDGARHEHLPGRCARRDARAHVDGEARRLAVDQLALAGVDPGAHVETESLRALDELQRAPDRPRGAVEAGEEAVSGGVDFRAAVALQLPADERPLLREQLAPAPVAELGGSLGRADEIGEEERGENAVRNVARRGSTEEVLDGLQREVVLHDRHPPARDGD